MKCVESCGGEIVRGSEMNQLAVELEDRAEESVTQPHGALDDCVKDWLHIDVRLADDPQDLARSRLLIERLGLVLHRFCEVHLEIADPSLVGLGRFPSAWLVALGLRLYELGTPTHRALLAPPRGHDGEELAERNTLRFTGPPSVSSAPLVRTPESSGPALRGRPALAGDSVPGGSGPSRPSAALVDSAIGQTGYRPLRPYHRRAHAFWRDFGLWIGRGLRLKPLAAAGLSSRWMCAHEGGHRWGDAIDVLGRALLRPLERRSLRTGLLSGGFLWLRGPATT